MQNLLLLGAGGHACVVADAALLQGAWSGMVASGAELALEGDELLPGVPQLIRAQAEKLFASGPVHVAIGNNASRRREVLALDAGRLVSVFHPMASISFCAGIASGCFVAAQAVVGPRATLAMGVIVNHNAVVDHDCQVGAFAHIAPSASLGGAVSIGPGVLVGAGVRILPGLSVCEGATLAAGAVVTHNITEPGTYCGIPARRAA